METYLLKFSACLLVFWLVYVLFLERQNMHRFKRFYLLGAFIVALIIPVLTITYYIEPVVTNFNYSDLLIPDEPDFTTATEQTIPFWDLQNVLWLVYGLGVLLFSTRFIINLVKMYKRISKNETIEQRSYIYVLLNECRIPHSFFKYIFLNKTKYTTDIIPKEVLLHEETHANQYHSLDILIVEILQIVFWFHPLIYLLKHHIKLNHEFLADQAVLNNGIDTKNYQTILLQFSSNTQEYALASAINYSSIKKRFTVMKTQTSKTRIWLSSLLLLPIVAVLFYSFAEREYVEKESIKTSENVKFQNISKTEGATDAMIKEYNDWIKKLNTDSSGLFIPVGTFERLVTIYDLMSKEQRKSVQTHPILQEMTPDLYLVKPNMPTAAQFEFWKDGKKFAIWLDGKSIPNSELINYEVSDIAHYSGSKVHKNEHNQESAQPHQFKLYTKNGFNKFFREAFVNDYKALSKMYSNAINIYLKGSQTDNSELKILYAQAIKLYKQFSEDELKKYNILPVPPVPSQKEKNLKKALNNSVNIINQSNPKTILSIFIKESGELIINNKAGDLGTLERTLKNLEIPKNYTISFKADEQSTTQMTEEVLLLLKKYNLLFEATQMGLSQKQQNQPTQKEIEAYNTWAKKIHAESKVLSKNARWFPPINEEAFIKFSEIYHKMSAKQKKQAVEYPFSGLDVKSNQQQKATPKQVAEYNAWAKKMNSSDNKIIMINDLKKFKHIYDIMSEEQKKSSETFPQIPPPPPPVTIQQYKNGKKRTLNEIIEETPKGTESGYEMLENGETHYFIIYKGKKTYYNSNGYITDNKGNVLPPPPPPPPAPKGEKHGKNVPPPPPPPAPYPKKSFETYAKEHPEKVTITKINGEILEIVEVPMEENYAIVNGKSVDGVGISLSLEEFNNLKITDKDHNVLSFSIMFPDHKPFSVNGNALDTKARAKAKNLKPNENVTLFDIKNDANTDVPPVIVTIKK